MTFAIPLLRAASFAIGLLAGSAAAHEGHDHGDQAKALLSAAAAAAPGVDVGPVRTRGRAAEGRAGHLSRPVRDQCTRSSGRAVTVETPAGPVARHLQGWRLSSPGAVGEARIARSDLHGQPAGRRRDSDRHARASPGATTARRRVAGALLAGLRAGIQDTLAPAAPAGRAGGVCRRPVRGKTRLPRGSKVLLVVAGSHRSLLPAWLDRDAHEGDDHEAEQAAARPTSETGAASRRRHAVRAQARAAHPGHPHGGRAGVDPSQEPRAAGPHHPRSQRQRLRAGLGQRPAVAAGRRLSQARHAP